MRMHYTNPTCCDTEDFADSGTIEQGDKRAVGAFLFDLDLLPSGLDGSCMFGTS